jgi:methyl-accepting chemotaxis protein
MKNSSSHSKSAALAVFALFSLGALWTFSQHGLDLILLALLLAAGAAAFLMRGPAPVADPRIASLQSMVADVAAGKVTGRIVNIGEKDEMGQLCWHINNMLDQLEACFREQQTVLRAASAGKYFRKAQAVGLHGVFREALEGSNQSLAVMEKTAAQEREHQRVTQEAQQEVACMISAAARGDFSLRLVDEGKQGFFLTLARDLNTLCATTERSLLDVASVLRSVAEGDLTREVDADYQGVFGELKNDTNSTVEQLRDVVERIKYAADAINTAAREIAAGNVDLSSRTEEQASSLEQTSSSMEDLNATVRRNADSARQASELAKASNALAVRAGEQVHSVVITMENIEASSRKIGDIIGVIDSIAFQTNILALNAAVEAARAGEQGRGFAVVATEVRSLAKRSADSAREIKDLINSSVVTVQAGTGLVRQAGETVGDVVSSFQRVAELVQDISKASREQSTGIEQITQAVGQMDEVTQQNAALVEEAASAAESLEEQAQGLVVTIGSFRLAGDPRTGARLAPPSR